MKSLAKCNAFDGGWASKQVYSLKGLCGFHTPVLSKAHWFLFYVLLTQLAFDLGSTFINT